ncbi:MAG TPA: formylglycine-generating enzyme family protein, partial [Methylomirabilota bacterium]|nr:formylglycine-generating enzyme family protein [Methylomirabilota bacterium]
LGWLGSRAAPSSVTAVPFTQLSGHISRRQWASQPLYEPMAPLTGGCAQFRRCTDGMRCVLVPEAEVEIGDDTGEFDQRPRHRAKISAFLIDAEPVSVTAYVRFLNSLVDTPGAAVDSWLAQEGNDRRMSNVQVRVGNFGGWEAVPGTEHQPIVLVSWFGANVYSLWANQVEVTPGASKCNQSFLPTEAQWEYAARGERWQKFPWGDAAATPELALFNLHTARKRYDDTLPLAPVNARLGMSPFGLQHMAGNIWQWCADFYDANFFSSPEASMPEPRCDRPTGIRVERGGSWIGPAELIRSSYRRGRSPLARGRCLGFRCTGLASEMPT